MQVLNELTTNFKSLMNTISINDIIDIFIVAFILYNAIMLVKKTRSFQILKLVIFVFFIYFLASNANLKVLSFILGGILNFMAIGLMVIFQPELRKTLEKLGNKSYLSKFNLFKDGHNDGDVSIIRNSIMKIVISCFEMSSKNTGAIIIIEKEMKLLDIISTGTYIDCNISEEILLNIFFHNAPLHDGAVIVRNNKIIAAGCFLPLSQNYSISKNLGTRHRASMGITEASDCIAVVVSEETGYVSFVKEGIIKQNLNKNELVNILNEELIHKTSSGVEKNKYFYLFNSIKKKSDVKEVDTKKNETKKQVIPDDLNDMTLELDFYEKDKNKDDE